jgi:hypothetical protein
MNDWNNSPFLRWTGPLNVSSVTNHTTPRLMQTKDFTIGCSGDECPPLAATPYEG